MDCTEPHTAETYAVGALPAAFADAAYDDDGRSARSPTRPAPQQFMKFLGADESLAMRTVLSWAWFRPSETAWDDGARWYRCDVVGGGDQTKELRRPPGDDAKGLLPAARRPVDGVRRRAPPSTAR